MSDLPSLTHIDSRTASIHATAVSLDGAGLLICGPAGAGKSGLAVQLMAMGATLIADDLCLIRESETGLEVARPTDRPELIELRGIGLCRVPLIYTARLRALLVLGPSNTRLPELERTPIFNHHVITLRHPYRFDTAAKIALWLRCN